LSETNEIGDFFDLLSRAKWWIFGVALVSMLVAGVFGYPGPRLYEASVPVRVQFPANLSRAPQPDRFVQMVKDPATVDEAANSVGLGGRVDAIEKSLVAAVSAVDPRLVAISVQMTNARQAKRLLESLVRTTKMQSMETIKDQIKGLKTSRSLNTSVVTQVDKVVAQGSAVGRQLIKERNLSASERLLAQVNLLQLNISALQSRANLQNNNAQIDADLESLNSAVLLDEAIAVRSVSPTYRAIGYALRGLIVGLVISIIAVFIPPIRRRLTS